MLLTSIDTDAAVDLHATVQKDLARLAAGLDSRFLNAGTTLASALEAIDRVIVALEDITTALDERAAGAAVRNLGAVARRLAKLSDAQAVRDTELTMVSSVTKTLHMRVMDMHQALQVLRIYGVNIKIAASGAVEFVGFVDRMTATLVSGERELEAFQIILKQLAGAVKDAGQAERLLAVECGKVVPEVPRKLAADALELEAYLAATGRAAKSVATIAREIQGRVAIVLGALQVGDSTRQRLEHAVSAIQLLDAQADADTAAIVHVRRLIAAQLDAAAADYDREAAMLVSALSELAPQTGRLLKLIEEAGGDEGHGFLQQLEHGIGNVDRLMSRLHEADHRSNLMLATITEALDALATRLDTMRTMRFAVQDIAVNTRLMCRRFGDAGKAVTVVASEVDLCAGELGNTLESVTWPIRELTQVGLAMKAAQADGCELDAASILSTALSTIRDGCRRTERGTSRGRDDAQQIIAIIEQTCLSLEEELAVGNLMRQAGSTLNASIVQCDDAAPNSAPDPILRGLLEGPADAVKATMDRIIGDPRHEHVVQMSCRWILERQFGHWGMMGRILTSAEEAEDFYKDTSSYLADSINDPEAFAAFLGFASLSRAPYRGTSRRSISRLRPE